MKLEPDRVSWLTKERERQDRNRGEKNVFPLYFCLVNGVITAVWQMGKGKKISPLTDIRGTGVSSRYCREIGERSAFSARGDFFQVRLLPLSTASWFRGGKGSIGCIQLVLLFRAARREIPALPLAVLAAVQPRQCGASLFRKSPCPAQCQ